MNLQNFKEGNVLLHTNMQQLLHNKLCDSKKKVIYV